MSPDNKEKARRAIGNMEPGGATCLWAGIQLGLQQFKDDHPEKVRAMMVLTDGMSEGIGAIPSDGHIPAMRRYGSLPATIQTFGFGYSLEPGLLQSIAEFGGGNYSFIPDSSMVGTVFVHAVAKLQSTFARRTVLTLTYSPDLGLEETETYVNKSMPIPVESGTNKEALMEYTIDLNTIMYGQSCDIYLRYECRPEKLSEAMVNGNRLLEVVATEKYQHGRDWYCETAHSNIRDDVTTLPPSEIAFRISRAQVVGVISQLFPLDGRGEQKPLREDRIPNVNDLEDLLKNLPANQTQHRKDPRNFNLIKDLIGDDIEKGQVQQALDEQHNNWKKWGQHYLSSLAEAHAHQIRKSFKDPGTQSYGANSLLFLARVDALDHAFNNLPPPKPSRFVVSRS
jgi:hypothetical protein